MIITKAGVWEMVKKITSHKDYGSGGHSDNSDRASELVKSFSEFANKMPDGMYIPDVLVELQTVNHGLLEDIIRGYGRPLDYLCSDCRYPKWCLTVDEAKLLYSHARSYEGKVNYP